MNIFYLPDLGEGLSEAEIHEWFVKEGDTVTLDQPMVAMETAKAVVDVPAPCSGVVAKLYGKVGDIINTGAALIEFVSDVAVADASTGGDADQGSVVGNLQHSVVILEEAATGVIAASGAGSNVKALPAVRALARQLGVDLARLSGTGNNGQLTKEDVERAAAGNNKPGLANAEPLRGVRRAMSQSMSQSHAEVVPVTLVDDADIHAWPAGTDITLRVIRAMVAGCQAEPALNAWFDGKTVSRALQTSIHLGIAMDAKDGLFVPVLRDVANTDPSTLRQSVDRFKAQLSDRTIPASELQGWTIMLSNFGSLAGRYANPVVVPPCVAILGTGRIREQAVVVGGQVVAHKIMPLSLSIDHRAVTGGEAARFLAAVIADLAQAN